jgi:uncharacterized membrane protein
MQDIRRPVIMLFLLLLTSLGPVLQTDTSTPMLTPLDEGVEPSQSERLELASTLWEATEPIPFANVELSSSTGMIRIQSGEFDPLLSDGPALDAHFIDFKDPVQTAFAILQLHEHDGNILEQLVKDYSITPLDFIADEGWLIRLPSPPLSSLEALQSDERVRWAGVQHPGWRMHSSLLEPASMTHLALVPSSDLAIGGLDSLSLDLIQMGAKEAWCGIGLCEVHYDADFQSVLLNNIMHDGRIIWTEPTTGFILHNAVAGAIIGLNDVAANASFTLDGSGETIAISDTGLDQDHPDIIGRVAGVYTNFGLDPSPSDSNTGHGTHVVLSALGDGTGDASAQGIAPGASLVMYALEHDPTGVFGRLGSIYDLLNDAEQKTARIAINAWGSNGNYGHYTADSRSVDLLVNDKNTVLPLFSVGDRGNQGASQVSAPATAKNVLAVGTSQTGALAGSVANISSQGPSLDGRIKPDIVAPGMNICSGLAEEAKSPAGLGCATGTHTDGSSLYISLSGSSHATAIAGGTTALIREFLREEMGLNSPSAALIKATIINGATDLGTPDIPNAQEGWGQIDLERTVLPMDGSTPLNTFFDHNKQLNAGFGLLYSFTLDPSHGIDMTLVWSDEEGSANAAQSSRRLVNDLDLILIDSSGNEWLGNDFSSGFSTTGGTADSVNNVERIKVAPGVLTTSGQWQVKVVHRGGTTQSFGLVMVADATSTPQSDLAAYNGSIVPSSDEPLNNDIITLQLSWINQGTLASNSFHVTLEDLTTNETLFDADRSGLGAGLVDSFLLQHQFTTTGTHSIRLSLDTLNQVSEMNDGTNGVNNNIWTQEIEVTALGVRVVALDAEGLAPTSPEDRATSAINTFDVLNDTGMDIPIHILHEGTGQQTVTISVTNVQMPQPGRPNFLLAPEDLWTKSVSEDGPYVVEGQGEIGDFKNLTVHIENEYSDLSDSSSPRYARAGTFVIDITARYQSQPTVSHTQRITIIVPEVNAVNIGAAGISGLSAAPGDSTGFVISVMNIGNTPGQYIVSCSSENRWQVMLGSSNSSTLEFEPLNIRESLPMYIQIFVPPVSNGVPIAGSTDTVTCWVNSLNDAEMNFTQSVDVLVLSQESFTSDLYDDLGPIGPSAINRNVMVDTGEQVSLNLTIENTGNLAIDLDVKIQPSNPLWPLQVLYQNQSDSRQISLSLQGGEVTTVNFVLGVPPVAEEGEANIFEIRTELNAQAFVSNTTILKVSDDLSLELTGPSTGVVETIISSDFSFGEFQVTNTGNAPLTLNWSHGLAPDGWIVGFANPSTYIEPREERTVRLGFIPPANTPASENVFELVVTVLGFNDGRMIQNSITTEVSVLASHYANITVEDSSITPFILVSRGDTVGQNIVIRNDGNVPLSGDVLGNVFDGDGNITSAWTVSCTPNSIESIAVGEQLVLRVELTPSESAQKGKVITTITLNSGDTVLGGLGIESSIESAEGSEGLFSFLPLYLSLPLVGVVLIGAIVSALRMKKSGQLTNSGEELVAPDAFVNPDHLGTRRDDALDIGHAIDEIASGEVSSDEIAAALAQSLQMPLPVVPTAVPLGLPPGAIPQGLPMPLPGGLLPAGLPPKALPSLPIPQPMPMPFPAPIAALPALGPPLPATGLPDGWTSEQWQHYGQQWLDRQ